MTILDTTGILSTVLEGIVSGSNSPRFSAPSDSADVQLKIDAFTASDTEEAFANLGIQSPEELADLISNSVNASPAIFSSDILIVKNFATDYLSYSKHESRTVEGTKALLTFNYNMTTASVDAQFSIILNNITRELAPPKNSKTFTYDFKFSQNQNGSITTGSISPVRTRTTTPARTRTSAPARTTSGGSSGGGGY